MEAKQEAPRRTLWLTEDQRALEVIDQRVLPHQLLIKRLESHEQVAEAIKDMVVRGAPLIGASAAYGMYLAALANPNPVALEEAEAMLKDSRPTAVNLFWAVDRMQEAASKATASELASALLAEAKAIVEEDVETCYQIGQHGLSIIKALAEKKGEPVNILTHCNAGWLGCVEWGTATSPIYQAHQAGIPVHVYVDETRPRNQGFNLTAWELAQAGVPHTLVVDNTGGHLMQHGMVDMAIVGTDRTTREGDVANKIGTYLKALAAYDNYVPFYVAVPSSSIDWALRNGLKEIPIEMRSEEEVKYIQGWDGHNSPRLLVAPAASKAANYGFDVTPARLVTALITERGVCSASEAGLLELFPGKK